MVGAPVAGQLFGDCGLSLLTPIIAQGGQTVRVAFASHNGPYDRHASNAVQVGHGAMDADVHLVQRLLHASQPIRAFGDQRCPVPDQRPQQAHRLGGTERPAQQSAAEQPLQPFTVASVRFRPARHPAQLPRIDQPHLKLGLFEHFVRHDPIHPRPLERDGPHAAVLQPGDQPLQARSRRWKTLDVTAVAGARRGADPMLFTPDINAGHIPAQHRKPVAFVRHDHLTTRCANTTARVGVCMDSRLGEGHIRPRQCAIATRSHADSAVSHASETGAATAGRVRLQRTRMFATTRQSQVCSIRPSAAAGADR